MMQIDLVGELTMVNVNTSLPIDQRYVEYLPSGDYSGFYQVGDGLRLVPPGIYYWSLPGEFLGERVNILAWCTFSEIVIIFTRLLTTCIFTFLIVMFLNFSLRVMEEFWDMTFIIPWAENSLEFWTNQTLFWGWVNFLCPRDRRHFLYYCIYAHTMYMYKFNFGVKNIEWKLGFWLFVLVIQICFIFFICINLNSFPSSPNWRVE